MEKSERKVRLVRLPAIRGLSLLLVLAAGACRSSGREVRGPLTRQDGESTERPSGPTRSADPDLRREAALAWGHKRLKGERLVEARQVLGELLRTDTEPLVRSAAAVSLGRLGGPESVEALVPGLHDASPMVRADVCRALADPLAEDADVDVRCAAARALGNFKEPEARQALLAALEDSRAAVRTAACQALRRSTGAKTLPPERGAWEAWLAGEKKEPRRRFLFW